MASQAAVQYGTPSLPRVAGRSSDSIMSHQWQEPLSEMVMQTQDERSALVSAIEEDFNFADPEAQTSYHPSKLRQNQAISTYVEAPETPWHPLNLGGPRSVPASIPTHEEILGPISKPCSDSRSNASAQLEQTDSGYFEGPDYHRDDSLTVGLDPHPFKRASITSESPPNMRPGHDPHHGSKNSPRPKGNEFQCPHCTRVLKCRSDLRKHERWHLRPFKCDVTGCERSTGFITQNDLDRHKKSKHYNGVYGKTKSYQCAGNNCRNPGKIWPRLDNFKQHVSKMHPDEDTDDVIRRSKLAALRIVEDSTSAIDPTAITKTPPRVTVTQEIDQSPPSAKSPIHQSKLSPSNTNHSFPKPSRASAVQPAIDPGSGYNEPKAGVDALLAAASIGHSTASRSNSQLGAATSGGAPAPFSLDSFSSALNAMTALVSAMQSAQTRPSISQGAVQPSQQPLKASSTKSRSSSKSSPEAQNSPSPPANAPADMFKLFEAMVSTMNQAQVTREPESVELDEQSRDDGWQKCPKCPKILKRNCDMNKHMKRHTKPYGCTFEDCEKVFGSKNDWKRHENSQHFQGEMWKCQQTKHGQHFDRCEFIAYHESQIMKHLTEIHFMTKVDAGRAATVGHIGRNNQMRFWCGFCGLAILLTSSGVGAWDERFNHIDRHFMKEGKRVDEWVDPIKYKTKSEMREEKEEKKKAAQSQYAQSMSHHARDHRGKGKRAASPGRSDEGLQAKRSKTGPEVISSMMYNCCTCDSWENATASSRCLHCQHARCGNCLSEIINGSTQQ